VATTSVFASVYRDILLLLGTDFVRKPELALRKAQYASRTDRLREAARPAGQASQN
jgi:hypothetical protein